MQFKLYALLTHSMAFVPLESTSKLLYWVRVSIMLKKSHWNDQFESHSFLFHTQLDLLACAVLWLYEFLVVRCSHTLDWSEWKVNEYLFLSMHSPFIVFLQANHLSCTMMKRVKKNSSIRQKWIRKEWVNRRSNSENGTTSEAEVGVGNWFQGFYTKYKWHRIFPISHQNKQNSDMHFFELWDEWLCSISFRNPKELNIIANRQSIFWEEFSVSFKFKQQL